MTEDSCSGQTLGTGASCAVAVKFCPTSLGSKGANLQIPLSNSVTPVLSAYLHNYESTDEEARRRMPTVLQSLEIPEVMSGGQSYTLAWSQLGYGESYLSNIVFFDCTGTANGACGDSYGGNFQSSGYLAPESVETGDWSYNGVVSRRFNYRYTFVAPLLAHPAEMAIRFYSKSQDDAESGNAGLSTLIPANLAARYYGQDGRRILKQIGVPASGVQ